MGKKPPPLSTLSLIMILLALVSSAESGTVTYWGQDGREGTLTEACNSGLYEIVNIAFLNKFGSGQSLEADLAGHCTFPNCQIVSTGIRDCHTKNVKVMLSIGGYLGNYNLSSAEDARQVADNIWDMFLGGQSNSRPLGDAALDGVDFDIEGEGRGDPANYAELARRLSQRSGAKKLYLTAAPQCPIPELAGQQYYISGALSTGLFDYIWIQFYNNQQCQFDSGNPNSFQNSWNRWISSVRGGKFYVGLPASPAKEAAGSGYVQPETVISQVLPFVRQSGNKYGGVMLWNRYYDVQTGYSGRIKGSV